MTPNVTIISTRGKSKKTSFRQAVLRGLAEDGGLYVPEEIPLLPDKVISNLKDLTLPEIGIEVASLFLKDELEQKVITHIVEDAINFLAPLHQLNKNLYSLELFHGPSLAFKDFGARFMARLIGWYVKENEKPLHILVATSGDTGGAVAVGFLGVEGINVSILYPKDRVSEFQELQLTTNGQNITAYEVEGSFDDCQRMVKEAFRDQDLRSKLDLSSANSINIARLVPQSFYYLSAISDLLKLGILDTCKELGFVVPSGNFGNLCAGLYAKNMTARASWGDKIKFVAATNVNDAVPRYLLSGIFEPRESIPTISNAMDVGNPSNFERLSYLFKNDPDNFRRVISGYSYTDEETCNAISQSLNKFSYLTDPHGAIGYLAASEWLNSSKDDSAAVFLETAHPVKFKKDVEAASGINIEIPIELLKLKEKKQNKITIPARLLPLKEYLLTKT